MNDSINKMKSLGISFFYIDEKQAEHIITTEYTAAKLMKYAAIFDRYRATEKKGQFVELDFSYLYDIALIDTDLRKIVFGMCIDVEETVKAILAADFIRASCSDRIVTDFVNSDQEYLTATYTAANLDTTAAEILGNTPIADLSLDDFLYVISFGTLQRFARFFYLLYAEELYNRKHAPFEPYLDSVRVLRNACAHNNTLLGRLSIDSNQPVAFLKNYSVISYLGNHGVKHRTLETNMSKACIHDLCCLLHLSSFLLPKERAQSSISKFLDFLRFRCTENRWYYIKAPNLLSAHRFLCDVSAIYYNESGKSLDK